jgi:hypothetical protein
MNSFKAYLRTLSLRISNGIAFLFDSQYNRPINYHLVPRISYLVDRQDYQPSSKDLIAALVNDLNKEKTEAVASQRIAKWAEAIASAEAKLKAGTQQTSREAITDTPQPVVTDAPDDKPKAKQKNKPDPEADEANSAEPKPKKKANGEANKMPDV